MKQNQADDSQVAAASLSFHVLTLFPEMIEQAMSHGIISRAIKQGVIGLSCTNIRDFAINAYKQVDDYPYGGGAGMVMMPQPIYDAYQSIKPELTEGTRVVYMSPRGRTLTQEMAQEFSEEKNLVILCGHYEGVDQRIIDELVTDEVSIGDYVLTGGELAAMVMMDCVARLVPGVLGKAESLNEESFQRRQVDGYGSRQLLEYPQYTRPFEFNGRQVPAVLVSGDHKKIEDWRKSQALQLTLERRKDLLTKDGDYHGK